MSCEVYFYVWPAGYIVKVKHLRLSISSISKSSRCLTRVHAPGKQSQIFHVVGTQVVLHGSVFSCRTFPVARRHCLARCVRETDVDGKIARKTDRAEPLEELPFSESKTQKKKAADTQQWLAERPGPRHHVRYHTSSLRVCVRNRNTPRWCRGAMPPLFDTPASLQNCTAVCCALNHADRPDGEQRIREDRPLTCCKHLLSNSLEV